MRVYLDEKPLPDNAIGIETTIAEAVEAARGRLIDNGGLIVSLKCDGEMIGAERIGTVMAQKVGEFDRIDLLSGEPRQVVIEAMCDIRTSFQETYAAVKGAAESLANGKLDESMKMINQCVAIWARANESVLQAISLLRLKIQDIVIDEKPLLDWLRDITARLRELKEAIEARDHVLLGDILRYEFDETLEQWERILDGFIAYVKSVDKAAVGA